MLRSVSVGWAIGVVGTMLALSAQTQQPSPPVPPASTSSPEPPIVVTSPRGMEYDTALNTWSGEEVTIVNGDLRITADKARVDEKKKEAYADGHVCLYQGNRFSTGDTLFYDFKTGKAHFVNFRAFVKPFYIVGKTADKIGEGEYRIQDGFLTTCDYENPHWRIRAQTIEIYHNDKVIAHQVRYMIGDKKVMAYPIVRKDLRDNRLTWEVVPGYRTKFGPLLLTTYNWFASEDLRGALHFDYRLKRGPATGADFEYNFHEFGHGTLSTYYAYDHEGLDLANLPIDEDRYRIHWDHRVEMPADITATALLNKLSDDSIEKDFFERIFRQDIRPDSYFEIAKRAPDWTLTLLTRPQVNDFFTTTERLPELALDAQRQPIFHLPIFYESESSVANLNQSFATAIDPITKQPIPHTDFDAVRFDTFHQLLWPHTYFDWLSLTPKVGGRGTYYDNSPTTSGGEGLGRVAFNTGLEASFKASRTWDYQNDRLDIHGLRHIFQSTVEYAYVWASRSANHSDISASHPASDLFQFDTTYANSIDPATGIGRLPFNRLQPLSFPQFDQIDAINDADVFRFGLRNKLQTKRNDQTWDLIDLNVFTDWHPNAGFTTAPDAPLARGGFSDLFCDLKLRPTHWLGFHVESRYDMRDERLNELDTETRFIPNQWLNIGLTTRYMNQRPVILPVVSMDKPQAVFGPRSSLFGTDIHLRLSEEWGLRLAHRFEAATGTLEEQEYTVARDLHDWTIAVGIREIRGDLQVLFFVSLKAFSAHAGGG